MTGIAIPLDHVMILAATLFFIGLTGVLVRRNVIFILMSLEIMLNACGLAFVTAGARWAEADGQIMYMLVLSLAAAEAALALGLILQLERRFRNLDIDAVSDIEMGYLLFGSGLQTSGVPVPPKAVGITLYGPYLIAVELASILLLAALVGAYHLGRRYLTARREEADA